MRTKVLSGDRPLSQAVGILTQGHAPPDKFKKNNVIRPTMSTTRKVKVDMVVGDDQLEFIGEAVERAVGELGEVKVCEDIKDRSKWFTMKNSTRYHGLAADARKAPIVVKMHGVTNSFGVYIEEDGQVSVSMDGYNVNRQALGKVYQGRSDRQTFVQAVKDQLLAVQTVNNIENELGGKVRSWTYQTQEDKPQAGEIIVELDLPGVAQGLTLTRGQEKKDPMSHSLGGGL